MVGPPTRRSTPAAPEVAGAPQPGSGDGARGGEVDGGSAPAPRLSDRSLSPVGRTLLITLWARAAESRRPDPIRRDPTAERLLARIDHDFNRYQGGWKSQIGVAVRGRCIDRAVDEFIQRNPGGLIVNLGCGLDGRSVDPKASVDRSTVDWLMVDQPEVLAFRRRLLGESPHETLVAADVGETAWIERAAAMGERPRLIIAEGVLMFLTEPAVRRMWGGIAARLPGSTGVFDMIGRLMVRIPALHDTLPATGVRFSWGWRGRRALQSWDPRVRVMEVQPMVSQGGARWRWMCGLRFVPPIRDQFVVVTARFGGATSE